MQGMEGGKQGGKRRTEVERRKGGRRESGGRDRKGPVGIWK